MSNYKKGHCQKVWDGLFWRFMHTHRSFFLQNPRLGMLVKILTKCLLKNSMRIYKKLNSFFKHFQHSK